MRIKLIQDIIDKITISNKRTVEIKNFKGRQFRDPSSRWLSSIPISKYKNKPINYLEIGSFHGASVLLVAESYGYHKDSKLFCIDTWEDYNEYPEYKGQNSNNFNIFMENIKNSTHINKIIPIKGYSEKEIPKLQDNYFDIIYVDGNHEEEYVYKDAILCYNKLKKNGYIIFDDYEWVGVKKAVDKFKKEYNLSSIKTIRNKGQAIFNIIK